jgi:signal transduction histidine kinase
VTVKTRITIFIAITGFTASFLFSIAVFFELIEQPFDLLDTILQEEAQIAVKQVVKNIAAEKSELKVNISTVIPDYWIEISEQESRKIIFRSESAKIIKIPAIKPNSKDIFNVPTPEGKNIPFRTRALSFRVEEKVYIIQIARPMEKLDHEIRELITGIISGLIFSTLFLIFLSRFVAEKILQPIASIRNLTRDISEKNLTARIPVGEDKDEFSELSRTINRMLDRLQYSFARQRNFLFDTSHELKTPLATIRLAIDDICSGNDEQLSSATRDNLSRLNNQVLRIEKLVKDLLNLSALETISNLETKTVNLKELLIALTSEYQFLADARNVSIKLQLPELSIKGDPEKLQRAFSNIFDNALKYNKENGFIEVKGQSTEKCTIISIANTGVGVNEDEIPKIFDQFYRAEKSRSALYGGSGLGLAIVKRIIELHMGKIEFASQPDKLTTLTIIFPENDT